MMNKKTLHIILHSDHPIQCEVVRKMQAQEMAHKFEPQDSQEDFYTPPELLSCTEEQEAFLTSPAASTITTGSRVETRFTRGIISSRFPGFTETAFTLFGICMLCPWNTWITAAPYFRARLVGTPFLNNFQSYISTTYMTTNIVCLLILLRVSSKLQIETRIVAGFIISCLVFIIAALMTVLTELDSTAYFIVTLFLVCLSGVAAAFLAGVIGFAASFKQECQSVIQTGQGIAGVVPAISQLFLWRGSDSKEPQSEWAMQLYFTIGIVINIAALIVFCSIPTIVTDSPQQQVTDTLLTSDESPLDQSDEIIAEHENETFGRVFMAVKSHAFAIFMNFLVTLALFPSLTSSVLPTEHRRAQSNELFSPLHFLCFNIADVIGKSMPIFTLKRISATWLVTFSVFRMGFLPLVLLCNIASVDKFGDILPRPFPVVFGDAAFFIILFGLGYSNGWLGTLIYINSSYDVSNFHSSKVTVLAGDVIVMAMSVGLCLGGFASFPLRAIMCLCNPFVTLAIMGSHSLP